MSIYTFETITVVENDHIRTGLDDMEEMEIDSGITEEEEIGETGDCEDDDNGEDDSDVVVGGTAAALQPSPSNYFDAKSPSGYVGDKVFSFGRVSASVSIENESDATDGDYHTQEQYRPTKMQAYETFEWQYPGPIAEGPLVFEDYDDDL